jgi:hypothetical protein
MGLLTLCTAANGKASGTVLGFLSSLILAIFPLIILRGFMLRIREAREDVRWPT